jgi:UPF0716 family protein affecting phage T7 exclusion
MLTDATWRGALLAAAFLISIPVSFVSKPVAYGCWALIPLTRGLVRRTVTTRRRADRTEDRRSTRP